MSNFKLPRIINLVAIRGKTEQRTEFNNSVNGVSRGSFDKEVLQISGSWMLSGFLYCFLGAVFLKLIFSWSLWISYLFLLVGLFILLFGYKKRETFFLFFCILGFFLGTVLTNNELEKIYPREERNFSGQGYVYQEPQFKEDYQKLIICPVVNSRPECREKFLLFDDLQKHYFLGELVEVECRLKNPENKYEKFNYVKFLAKDRIYQICQGAKIKKMDPEEKQPSGFYDLRNFFYKTIFKFKKFLEYKINLSFPYPESAYLAGLLLGGEDRLPEEVQEDFRRTGTTHTVAVSGFNITILAGFFMVLGILLGFYRQKAFWLAVIGIVFFVLMIGAPSSAVRAAVMGVLLLWAAKKGRLADSVSIILLTAVLMVAFSPLILLYDVGFQLSFLASLSIVLIYGPLSEKFNIKSDFLELKSILLVTISAQMGVLGIILYNFETFSPISLLANLIILPLVPVIMLTGFLTILTGFASPVLASFVALPTGLALSLEIAVIRELAKIPWASLEIGDIGIVGLMIYYLIFAVLVVFLRQKMKR